MSDTQPLPTDLLAGQHGEHRALSTIVTTPDQFFPAQVKEGKKITGPEQLKDAAFGCARIRGDTLGIVGLGEFH